MALLALKRKEQMITSEHVRHLAHLYLHPSLYASFRPFWVVREMRRLTRDGSIHFNPTSETLEKALLSFRMRRNRHRRAVELVEYFKRKWGDDCQHQMLATGWTLCLGVEEPRAATIRNRRRKRSSGSTDQEDQDDVAFTERRRYRDSGCCNRRRVVSAVWIRAAQMGQSASSYRPFSKPG